MDLYWTRGGGLRVDRKPSFPPSAGFPANQPNKNYKTRKDTWRSNHKVFKLWYFCLCFSIETLREWPCIDCCEYIVSQVGKFKLIYSLCTSIRLFTFCWDTRKKCLLCFITWTKITLNVLQCINLSFFYCICNSL